MAATTNTTTIGLRPLSRPIPADRGGGSYLHLAAELASPDPRSERLRDLLSDLRQPLAAIAASPAVLSSRLFRNARLDHLSDTSITEPTPATPKRYEIVILVRLTGADAVGELLDQDALRELFGVLHTHGRAIVITPAINAGATEPDSGPGRLNLIRHVRAADPVESESPGLGSSRESWRLELAQRELLLPIDPDSTPFLRIDRSELDASRSRSLVRSIVRPTDEFQPAPGADSALRDLYWELPLGRPDRVRPGGRNGRRSGERSRRTHITTTAFRR
jgi:hypothetical protein